jgi:Ca2+-binding EF-hand superfamily protein
MYDKDKIYMKESLNEAFEYFDKDHTGYIEIDELKVIMGEGEQAEV